MIDKDKSQCGQKFLWQNIRDDYAKINLLLLLQTALLILSLQG